MMRSWSRIKGVMRRGARPTIRQKICTVLSMRTLTSLHACRTLAMEMSDVVRAPMAYRRCMTRSSASAGTTYDSVASAAIMILSRWVAGLYACFTNSTSSP